MMINTPFKFVFSHVWKGIYIDVFAQDERLLSVRGYACECLVLMQTKANELNVYDKGFHLCFQAIVHCVYQLKVIINQCDSRLNPKVNKDNVLYTGKLAQGKTK